MRTLSLWESGESNGLVSLAALLEGADMTAGLADFAVSDYARVITRGGWRLLVGNPDGANDKRLIAHLKSLGLLFESLVIRDLRVYAAANGASVYHYRDETGLEVDAIIETLDGRWLACEVKLGGEEAVNAAAKNLPALRNKVADEQRSRLAGLLIVTAGKVALTRPDGVHVVPLGCLMP